jgi:PAS domain S-box-containing protein
MEIKQSPYHWLEAIPQPAAVFKKHQWVCSNLACQQIFTNPPSQNHPRDFALALGCEEDDVKLFEKWITEKSNKTQQIQALGVSWGLDARPIDQDSRLVLMQDTTELDQLRHSQEVNNERFGVLSNSTMEGIAMLHGKTIIDANPKFAEILGFKEATELIKKDISTFFSTRNWRRLETRDPRVFEMEITNQKQQEVFIETQLTKSPNPDTPDLSVLVLLDVTNKKRTERDLMQTKERFRLLVEANPFGLFLLVKNKIRYANRSAIELLDYKEEEDLYEEDFNTLFMSSDRQRLLEDMQRIQKGEKPPYTELTMLNRSGDKKEVGVQMVLSFFDQEPAIQVTVNDLTTRMQLVREQMRAEAAEESNVLLKVEIERHEQTQLQLKKAEQFNRSVIESSIDMILTFDVSGKLIQFNHAASVEFGWTYEDAVKLTPNQFLSNKKEYDGLMLALKKDKYYAGEVTGLRSTGEEFQMLMSVASLRDDSGVTIGAVSVGRDVTDIRLAETELRRSEERYRDILDHATDLVFLVDKRGVFTYANPAFFETLGYDSATLAKTKLQEIAVEATKTQDWMGVFVGDRKELVFIAKDGSPRKMLGGGSLQKDQDGAVTGLRGVFLDVSEMRGYQRDAMVQSAKLESIFNSTRYLLMFTVDHSLSITAVNENFTQTFSDEFGFEATVGTPIIKKLKQLASKDLYKGQLALFRRAAKGVQQQFELPLINKNNEVVWYQVFFNPVRFDDGSEELSCIAYDITERKEIDQQIRGALKEKEVLLQEVHHRVKNNLQVISSMLNLQRRFINDPLMLDILEESQNRISTMSFIHESLYQNTDFSSISFAVYLERLATNLIHSYSKLSCHVSLETKLDEVHINLKQAIPCGLIVNELVSNALKYAYIGQAEGTLFLRIEQKGDTLEIEVADDGVGLPEGFNFESNDSLGVYLVQALTDQIDGELIVDNKHSTNALETTTGSSFLVRFTPQSD